MAKWSLFQTWLDKWSRLPPPPPSDLTNKTVMVTGANTGLGFEAAKHFAKMNPACLILACRNEESSLWWSLGCRSRFNLRQTRQRLEAEDALPEDLERDYYKEYDQ